MLRRGCKPLTRETGACSEEGDLGEEEGGPGKRKRGRAFAQEAARLASLNGQHL